MGRGQQYNEHIEIPIIMSIESESIVVLGKNKTYLRHKNKTNENKVLSYCETLRYMQIHMHKEY